MSDDRPFPITFLSFLAGLCGTLVMLTIVLVFVSVLLQWSCKDNVVTLSRLIVSGPLLAALLGGAGAGALYGGIKTALTK